MASENSEQKIDIHKGSQKYRAFLGRLHHDRSLSDANRQHILRFLTDCELGKTILGRQKKRIGPRRLLKYGYALRQISRCFGNKDFAAIDQHEMERFIADLENNALSVVRNGTMAPIRLGAWGKRDIKVTLKKFYKWLLGDGKAYPDLVAWLDTNIEQAPPASLSIDEIRKLVDYAAAIRGKALIWALFETGARVEELLNVRHGHVVDKETHLVVWIEYPKTFRRSLPVYEGARYMRDWLAMHPLRGEPKAPVFPLTYAAVLKYLQRIGMKALGRPVRPHLMRDSFATWLASKRVGRYQMCKLMGWSMSSDMPDRYINRTGVVEEDAIKSIRGDQLSQVERENRELKGSLQRLEAQYNQIQERLARRARVDELLDTIFKDVKFADVVARKMKEKGLGDRLMKL